MTAPHICRACPRACGVDRRVAVGYCGMPDTLYIARAALHPWEEPPISGTNGSGTVFFTGCNLRCVFCQNRTVSHEHTGQAVTSDDLARIMLDLQEAGAHNINLVTPTHYTEAIARTLREIKPRLHIPVVWNSSAYESSETLELLDGLVDIFLPDFKYSARELSAAYAGAADYAEVAAEAVRTMYRLTGKISFDANGLMTKGVIVRHLVLPGCRKDSIAIVERLADILPVADVRISLMRQYTPEFAMDCPYKNLHRRVTEFEYRSVVDAATALGFDGYTQGADAASADFTPDFSSRVIC